MNETRDLSRASWFRSSYSNGQGGNCTEVALNLPGIVAVRDSRHLSGPVLVFTPATWRRFTAEVRGL